MAKVQKISNFLWRVDTGVTAISKLSMVPIEVRRVGSVGVAHDGVRVEFVAGVEIVALGVGDSVVMELV